MLRNIYVGLTHNMHFGSKIQPGPSHQYYPVRMEGQNIMRMVCLAPAKAIQTLYEMMDWTDKGDRIAINTSTMNIVAAITPRQNNVNPS